MSLATYSTTHKPHIEEILHSFLSEKQEAFTVDTFSVHAIQKIIDMITAGKMLRGLLVLIAYESKKGDVSNDAYLLAAALEMLHTALLIHDDIMDNDSTRRGKPTIFAQYLQEAKETKATNAALYSHAMTICMGDLAFFFAFEIIGMLKDSPLKSRILLTIAQEMQKVGFAQMKDVLYGLTDVEPARDEILSLYLYKTARYSFSLPLLLGSQLAGQSAETIRELERFGENLGIAFQIKDDEFSIWGDQKVTGKPTGSDIRGNKKTVYRQMLFHSVSDAVRDELSTYFGNDELSEIDLKRVTHLFEEHNIRYSIDKLRDKKSLLARETLSQMAIPDSSKDLLTSLVDFTNVRTS